VRNNIAQISHADACTRARKCGVPDRAHPKHNADVAVHTLRSTTLASPGCGAKGRRGCRTGTCPGRQAGAGRQGAHGPWLRHWGRTKGRRIAEWVAVRLQSLRLHRIRPPVTEQINVVQAATISCCTVLRGLQASLPYGCCNDVMCEREGKGGMQPGMQPGTH